MQLSRSSYYYKQKHIFDKQEKDKPALHLIKEIFESKQEKAGIRTIAMILESKYGIKMNLKKIAREQIRNKNELKKDSQNKKRIWLNHQDTQKKSF